MKSYFAVGIAVIFIFGLGISSDAQEADNIVVNVPFDFVVAARIMPAGTYSVGRLSDDPHSGIIFRGSANSAVVLPMTVEGASIPKALLTFERSGEKYCLGKIETPGSIYTIVTPRQVMTLARTPGQTAGSAGGTN